MLLKICYGSVMVETVGEFAAYRHNMAVVIRVSQCGFKGIDSSIHCSILVSNRLVIQSYKIEEFSLYD